MEDIHTKEEEINLASILIRQFSPCDMAAVCPNYFLYFHPVTAVKSTARSQAVWHLTHILIIFFVEGNVRVSMNSAGTSCANIRRPSILSLFFSLFLHCYGYLNLLQTRQYRSLYHKYWTFFTICQKRVSCVATYIIQCVSCQQLMS